MPRQPISDSGTENRQNSTQNIPIENPKAKLFESVGRAKLLKTAIDLVSRFKRSPLVKERLDQGFERYISGPELRQRLKYEFYESPENEAKRGWVCGVALFVQSFGDYRPTSYDLTLASLVGYLTNIVDDLTEGKTELSDPSEIKSRILQNPEVRSATQEIYALIDQYPEAGLRAELFQKLNHFLSLALKGVAHGNKLIEKGDYNLAELTAFRALTNWSLALFQFDLLGGIRIKKETRDQIYPFLIIGTEIMQQFDDVKDLEDDNFGLKSPNILKALGQEEHQRKELFIARGESLLKMTGFTVSFQDLNEVWEDMTRGSLGYLVGFYKMIFKLMRKGKEVRR